MIWALLSRGSRGFKYIRAEAPCWKGEVELPLWEWSICIGWQRSGLMEARDE